MSRDNKEVMSKSSGFATAGLVLGIIGVFLSVPIAAIIKFSIDKYVQNKIHIRIQR